MKKRQIILTTAAALFTLFVQAQNSTSFGVRGGINFQNINGKDENDDKVDNDLVTRFNVGVNAEIPVGPDFYLQPGLLFTTKGAKQKEVLLSQTYSANANLSYLEVPVNFIYKPLLGTGRLVLGFGPYVGFGLGGKVKYESPGASGEGDVKFKNTVKASDPDDVFYFKKIDAGANLLAGYEFSNKFSFQLNAQLGLAKINPDYEGVSDDKTSLKNTGFGLSLGYRFNR